MSEEMKFVRLQLSVQEPVRERLEDLAATNTAENMSYMVRVLVNRAYEDPKLFGLLPPRIRGEGAPEVLDVDKKE